MANRFVRLFAAAVIAFAAVLLPACTETYGTQPTNNDVEQATPGFTDEDIAWAQANLGVEQYGALDELGRCTPALACLGPETMPERDEERGDIHAVHPTGWHTTHYEGIVEGGSLYNRCHLIAWSLGDENANERNLVTGTRWMNAEAMLPYEEQVARYIDRTGNHVLYRATPVFEGDDLVARGVLLEARSVEDDGAGISFSAWCENVQPGIGIDYATGESWIAEDESATAASSSAEARDYVANTNSKRFHLPECSSVGDISAAHRTDVHTTRDALIAEGYRPCGACRP